MNSAYMCYYEHLAKLARVANKQTLFLAHVLYRMEFDDNTKQMIVNLTPHAKKEIIKTISGASKNFNRLANQYLQKLSNAGFLKSIGGGAYLIDPQSYGGAKYVPKQLRLDSGHIYEHRVFSTVTEGEVEAYIVTESGEKVEL